MSEKGQFSLDLNTGPVQKNWTDYTREEIDRLKTSIAKKRATSKPFSDEEADFLKVDKKYWGSGDHPWSESGGH